MILLNSKSVSKTHAKIGFTNNEFWIFDYNSTYGTLKLIPDIFNINKKTDFVFIMSKFAFKFHVLKNNKVCKCKFKLKNAIKNPESQN